MQGPAELRACLVAEPRPDQGGRGFAAKRVKVKPDGRRVGLQLADDLGLIGTGAGAEQQHDRQPVDPRRQVGQPAQGRRVRPLRVVDRKQQRRPRGQVGGEPVQPVHGGVRHVGRGWLGAVENRPRPARRAVKQRVPLAGTRRRTHRFQQLPDDAIGKTLLKGQTARGQGPHSLRVGGRGRGAENGGLADSRGPPDNDHGAVSLGRGRDGGRRRGKFGVTVKN